MHIKIVLLSYMLVLPSFAMEENQLKIFNKERLETAIFLLKSKQQAEEVSWCGIGQWQKNKPVVDLAAKIAEYAKKLGLTEEQRKEIMQFISEREEESSCDSAGMATCVAVTTVAAEAVAQTSLAMPRGAGCLCCYGLHMCCFACGGECKHKGRCPQLEEALTVPRAVSMDNKKEQ